MDSPFDPKMLDEHMLLRLLAYAHRQVAVENPISMHKVNVNDVDAPGSLENRQAIGQKALKEFKAEAKLIGTIHVDHEFYVSTFFKLLESMHNADKKGKGTGILTLPNGCCSREDCCINVYYDKLAKHCVKVEE